MQDIIQFALAKAQNDEKTTILANIINDFNEDDICTILYNVLIKNPNVVNRIVKISDEDELEASNEEELIKESDMQYQGYYTPEWEERINEEVSQDININDNIVKKCGYWNIYNNLRTSIIWRMEYESHENYTMGFEDYDVKEKDEEEDVKEEEEDDVKEEEDDVKEEEDDVKKDENDVKEEEEDEVKEEEVINPELSEDLLIDFYNIINESKDQNKSDDEIINLLIEYTLLNESNSNNMMEMIVS
jgi:hypothetical protein